MTNRRLLIGSINVAQAVKNHQVRNVLQITIHHSIVALSRRDMVLGHKDKQNKWDYYRIYKTILTKIDCL